MGARVSANHKYLPLHVDSLKNVEDCSTETMQILFDNIFEIVTPAFAKQKYPLHETGSQYIEDTRSVVIDACENTTPTKLVIINVDFISRIQLGDELQCVKLLQDKFKHLLFIVQLNLNQIESERDVLHLRELLTTHINLNSVCFAFTLNNALVSAFFHDLCVLGVLEDARHAALASATSSPLVCAPSLREKVSRPHTFLGIGSSGKICEIITKGSQIVLSSDLIFRTEAKYQNYRYHLLQHNTYILKPTIDI